MMISAQSDKQELFLRLLEQSRLPEREVAALYEKALNVSYWRELNPQLSVEDAGALQTNALVEERELKLLKKMESEGYFKIESLFPTELMSRMRECVERLRREGWPPVFAYVYDEFWQVWRVPALEKLLSGLLGESYREVLHHVWCHYVLAHERSGGWPPHIDGHRNRVTVWIALGDATLANGCMYLIPRNLTPQRILGRYKEIDAFTIAELRELLQSSRALPVPAGSVLGWGYDVIHWGASVVEPTTPRISISLEFAGVELETASDKIYRPEIDGGLPSFSMRIKIASNAILDYKKFEPLAIRYAGLAERLLQS